MKKLFLSLIFSLLLIPLATMSADRIIIKGKNQVEWTPSKIMTDIAGKSVEVWDTDNTQFYGDVGTDRELTNAQKDLTDAQTLNCPVYKQEQIDNFQVQVDRLNSIKVKVVESNQ